MRATYEDLLRVARRRAVDAYKSAGTDTTDLVAGWQATLTATRHHLRWLRLEMSTTDFASGDVTKAEGRLYALAQSLGAGADLLASQNGSTEIALDNRKALSAARSEVASIATLGARAALTTLSSRQFRGDGVRRLYQHLVDVVAELELLRGRSAADIGPLRGLSTRLPTVLADEPSRIARLGALWQMAHEATSPRELLTRDMRSTTGQLRTVCGYVSHLASVLHAVGGARPEDLRALVQALRTADTAAAKVGRAWRTRLCDVNGRSDGPAELAFIEVLGALKRWLRDGERLRKLEEAVPNDSMARTALDVIDELLHSGHLVARAQQESVMWLIRQGRLFVPRPELAKRDPEFLVRPTVWLLRYPQPSWVRTDRVACFDELTTALAESVDQLSVASEIGRELAGSSGRLRPVGRDRITKPPAVRESRSRWHKAAATDRIPAIYADPSGPER